MVNQQRWGQWLVIVIAVLIVLLGAHYHIADLFWDFMH